MQRTSTSRSKRMPLPHSLMHNSLAPRFTATESLHRSGSNNFQLVEETSLSCHRSGKISRMDRRQLQSPEPYNSLTTEASSHPLIIMWLSKPVVFWPRIPDIFFWRRRQDDMAMWESRVGNCDDSAYRLWCVWDYSSSARKSMSSCVAKHHDSYSHFSTPIRNRRAPCVWVRLPCYFRRDDVHHSSSTGEKYCHANHDESDADANRREQDNEKKWLANFKSHSPQ